MELSSISGCECPIELSVAYIYCRWRLVVHGGIDGFSRLIVFLQCSSNNRSSTILRVFQNGVGQYGLPERIWSGRGGENVEVRTLAIWQLATKKVFQI